MPWVKCERQEEICILTEFVDNCICLDGQPFPWIVPCNVASRNQSLPNYHLRNIRDNQTKNFIIINI
jgi:hypothetical protein